MLDKIIIILMLMKYNLLLFFYLRGIDSDTNIAEAILSKYVETCSKYSS